MPSAKLFSANLDRKRQIYRASICSLHYYQGSPKMDESNLSNAVKVNKLLNESAVRAAMDYITYDMELREFISDGAAKCENFTRTASTLVCKGPFGWGEATRKQAVLRHPETREPIYAERFRRHLDAAARAVYWALYGVPD